jgi:hypothetical protein
MKLRKYKIAFIIMGAIVMNSCSKQETDPLMDARPDVPVSITNAKEFRPDPTVTCSLKDSVIQIDLSIPAQSGRTIAEITKIATSTSFTKIQASGTTGFYVATPIPVNGTSYSYKTSLAQYFALNAPTAATGANPPAKASAELGFRFYFLIKLDDGTQLVTMPVRVLVVS